LANTIYNLNGWIISANSICFYEFVILSTIWFAVARGFRGQPFGPEALVFKVAGKTFALADNELFASVTLKCSP
jgi:hypothetical protein